MPKPNFFPKVQPKTLQETVFPAQEGVNLDPDAFDDAIRSQGLTFVHYRAMKCPIGVVDADDERHPHGDHGGCSNGFLYKVVGPLTCVPSNNSNSPQVQDMGILNQVNLMVTAPRFYDVLSTQGEPMRVLMAPYDRMYLSEESITVIQWQLFEACGGPTDKMDYPVAAVEHLVNAQGKELLEDCDFVVEGGLIKWVLPSADGPVPNPDAGTGGILSIRYCYRPYWYVRDLPHEIRVTQLENFEGVRQTERMNQQASLQREYIFENQANDKDAKDAPADNGSAKPETPLSRALGQSNLRQILAPRSGGFGPR